MSKIYEPREAVAMTQKDGSEVFLVPGRDFLAEDHELVRKNPQMFRQLKGVESAVEQATAAPGEKRKAGRPRKTEPKPVVPEFED